eukprot:gene18486-23619_t
MQIVSEQQLGSVITWKLTGLIEESQISYGVGVM